MPTQSASVPEGSLPGELGHFVAALNTVNSESDAEYVSSLARLRSDKEQVLADASRLLVQPLKGQFALHHSVLLAVGALRDPAALDLLRKVALNPQPLPPKEALAGPEFVEANQLEHEVEDVVQSTMLALDAIDESKC
jgi:hypothetical protein